MRRDDLQRQLDAFVQAKQAACEAMTDQQALDCVGLYPTLRGNGALIKAGTRVRVGDDLYRAAVDLWDRPDSTPETAPTLWERVAYHGDVREIPDPITAGLAFSNGELGLWTDGHVYRSKLDNNVWTPEQYPAAWELVE